MKFHERLKKARTDAGLSQAEVAEYFQNTGFSILPPAISRWENGTRKPGIVDFVILCECYKIYDAMQLLTGNPSLQQPDTLLDGLNRMGKDHAANYIKMLKSNPVFTEEEKAVGIRTFRLFDIPVSAGTGEYLDSGNYEIITANDLIPDETDYAVRVSGDSMEPRYHDGQVLFIREQETLEDGEIGIFSLNDESFVKKLIKGSLVSLNPKYESIKINEFDSLRIYGKVIGVS